MSQPQRQALPVHGRAIWTYLLLVVGLAWLAALPIWVKGIDLTPSLPMVDQNSAPGTGPKPTEEQQFVDALIAQLCAIGMMFTPAIAAVLTLLLNGVKFSRVFPLLGAGHSVRVPGFTPPTSGTWPYIRRLLIALFGTLGISLLILLVIAIATPVWPINEHTLAHQSASALGIPFGLLILLQFVQVPLGAVFNAIPAAGEELGWRGYLYPALTERFGFTKAVIIGGAVWGLWHAPLVMLGYNYGLIGLGGVGLMMIACVALGTWLAFLYGKSGSVWVPAIAHGAFNAAAGLPLLFWPAGESLNGVATSALGPWALIVLLPLAAVLVWRVNSTNGGSEKISSTDLHSS